MESETLEQKIERLEKSIEFFKSKTSLYENGDAKLYYALQRKMTEMANVLNKTNLENVDLEDKNSKTFDRISIILQKCETIAASAKSLGEVAGVTGDENKDVNKKTFVDTIAESRR